MQNDNKNAGQLPDVYRLKEHAAVGYLPAERPVICRTFARKEIRQQPVFWQAERMEYEKEADHDKTGIDR